MFSTKSCRIIPLQRITIVITWCRYLSMIRIDLIALHAFRCTVGKHTRTCSQAEKKYFYKYKLLPRAEIEPATTSIFGDYTNHNTRTTINTCYNMVTEFQPFWWAIISLFLYWKNWLIELNIHLWMMLLLSWILIRYWKNKTILLNIVKMWRLRL